MTNETDSYIILTRSTSTYPFKGTGENEAINYCLVGLAGEAGEALNKWKKVLRGDLDVHEQRMAIVDELGDSLWYITRALDELGVSLGAAIELNTEKLLSRKARNVLQGSGDTR